MGARGPWSERTSPWLEPPSLGFLSARCHLFPSGPEKQFESFSSSFLPSINLSKHAPRGRGAERTLCWGSRSSPSWPCRPWGHPQDVAGTCCPLERLGLASHPDRSQRFLRGGAGKGSGGGVRGARSRGLGDSAGAVPGSVCQVITAWPVVSLHQARWAPRPLWAGEVPLPGSFRLHQSLQQHRATRCRAEPWGPESGATPAPWDAGRAGRGREPGKRKCQLLWSGGVQSRGGGAGRASGIRLGSPAPVRSWGLSFCSPPPGHRPCLGNV